MVELTELEKTLPYVKYFYKDLAPIPKDKIAIGKGAPADPSKALKIEDKNLFLAGKDTDITAGFCVMKNGTGFVANTTYMPKVTVDMMDWWFGWHSIESDLRYKLWDHDDHYYARADKPDYVKDPMVPLHQKTWGVTHFILEDIGMGPSELVLSFKKPTDFGYDSSIIGTKYCHSLVCAIGTGSAPAFMTHKYYTHKDGISFESRFWIGYGFENGNFVKLIPAGEAVPEIVVRALFNHNIKEYTNLASLLPSLYEEEKTAGSYEVGKK